MFTEITYRGSFTETINRGHLPQGRSFTEIINRRSFTEIITKGRLPQVVSTRRLTEGHLPQGCLVGLPITVGYLKVQILEYRSKIIYKVDCCVLLFDFYSAKSLTANYSVLRAKCMSKTPGDMFSSTTQSPSHHNSHTHCCVMSGCWQCCVYSALLPTTTFVHVYVWVVA